MLQKGKHFAPSWKRKRKRCKKRRIGGTWEKKRGSGWGVMPYNRKEGTQSREFQCSGSAAVFLSEGKVCSRRRRVQQAEGKRLV